MLDEPRQPAAESYRALRTSILLSTDEGPPQTLLVTSTAPEEGKTATAVNLAVGIAQSGYSVLLVDADMRKPRIGAIFDLPNEQRAEHGASRADDAGARGRRRPQPLRAHLRAGAAKPLGAARLQAHGRAPAGTAGAATTSSSSTRRRS